MLPYRLGPNLLTRFGLTVRQRQPVEIRMQHIILPPDNLPRQRVAGVPGHPIHRHGILPVHPVPATGMDLHMMNIPLGIGLAQGGQLITPFGCYPISIEATIMLANMNGKGQIAQTHRGCFVRMPSHHGGRRQGIRHPRGHLIDSIPAG